MSEVHRQMDAWRGAARCRRSGGHLRLVTPGRRRHAAPPAAPAIQPRNSARIRRRCKDRVKDLGRPARRIAAADRHPQRRTRASCSASSACTGRHRLRLPHNRCPPPPPPAVQHAAARQRRRRRGDRLRPLRHAARRDTDAAPPTARASTAHRHPRPRRRWQKKPAAAPADIADPGSTGSQHNWWVPAAVMLAIDPARWCSPPGARARQLRRRDDLDSDDWTTDVADIRDSTASSAPCAARRRVVRGRGDRASIRTPELRRPRPSRFGDTQLRHRSRPKTRCRARARSISIRAIRWPKPISTWRTACTIRPPIWCASRSSASRIGAICA